MPDIHDFILFSFNDGVSPEVQADAMRTLQPIILALDGCKSREYFYDAAKGKWADHMVYASVAQAEAAEKIFENPKALEAFALMDKSSVSFVRGEKRS